MHEDIFQRGWIVNYHYRKDFSSCIIIHNDLAIGVAYSKQEFDHTLLEKAYNFAVEYVERFNSPLFKE